MNNPEPNDDYGDAIGFVMRARQAYDTLLESEGPDSPATKQAHSVLLEGLERREDMRVRHDAQPDHPQRPPKRS